jgi:hypothetical protein
MFTVVSPPIFFPALLTVMLSGAKRERYDAAL